MPSYLFTDDVIDDEIGYGDEASETHEHRDGLKPTGAIVITKCVMPYYAYNTLKITEEET